MGRCHVVSELFLTMYSVLCISWCKMSDERGGEWDVGGSMSKRGNCTKTRSHEEERARAHACHMGSHMAIHSLFSICLISHLHHSSISMTSMASIIHAAPYEYICICVHAHRVFDMLEHAGVHLLHLRCASAWPRSYKAHTNRTSA